VKHLTHLIVMAAIVAVIAVVGAFNPSIGPVRVSSHTEPRTEASAADALFAVPYSEDTQSVSPAAIRADGVGNIYTAGTTRSDAGDRHLLLVKYDAEGGQDWVRDYDVRPWCIAPDSDGQNPGGNCTSGEAVDLEIDPAGNAVVVGTSYNSKGLPQELVVVKYSSQGKIVWANRFFANLFAPPDQGTDTQAEIKSPDNRVEAKDLQIDSEGNVYVNGIAYLKKGPADKAFFLVKYGSDGQLRWTQNQLLMEADQNYRTVLDHQDQVFLAGAGSGPIGGRIQGEWNLTSLSEHDRETGADLGSTGVSDPEKIIPEYAPSRYRIITDAVASDNGNILILADFVRPEKHAAEAFVVWDFGLSRLPPTCPELAWVRKVGGRPITKLHGYQGLDLEEYGDAVYVFGARPDADKSSVTEYVLIKYDMQGKRIWTRTFGNDESPFTDFEKMAVDEDGNIILAGTAKPAASDRTDTDIVTVKLDKEGKQKWSHRYSSGGRSIDRFIDLDADDSGNVLVTGSSSTDTPSGRAIVTIKYAP
jgi:hypothetical protein